ncbi:aldo/keto reductase [Sphingobacterium sp. DN00404]|uniref:Aldo/keto reductase n=1 Tax=Sphingobacterium micropteri TaxID=2763501 RepID=A0ABR7YS13_9SPHI|nr:aldo/keto reductase [Sphingobacterium micropteri]MBD1434133.1 aldo/keto reductase [Sphingobacterium micropteri]
MEYRNLGNSDLQVSAITFGAWAAGGWMWGSTDRKEAVEAIQASYDVGVTSIDTAPIYGQGTSEEIVGEAVRKISRDKVQLLTKFGMRWDLNSAKGDFAMHTKDNNGKALDVYRYAGKESVIYECEQSLKRLRTDYIDLYQIHWPDSTTLISETFEAVSRLIEQGKVRYAGVCNYSSAQIAEAEQTLNIVSNQVAFSMVNRGIEAETVPYCIKQNKSILAYSPLQRGLLTGKIHSSYTFQEGDHRASSPHFQPDFIEKTNVLLDKIKPIADSKNASLGQLVLRWTIERPGITIALAGARNAQQAIQNAQSIDIQLTTEEIETINQLVEGF